MTEAPSQARVAILELPARFGDPESALSSARTLLGTPGPKPDLALLPEASLTGYVDERGDFGIGRFAEALDGPTVASITRLARESGVVIAAPLIEQSGERRFNAFVVVSPDGELLAHYRKRHPWYPETWANAGDLPLPVFEVAGVAFALAICFDVHFLEAESADVLRSVDALLMPTAWVDPDADDARCPLFAHLARRFGVSVVNANWGPGVPCVRGQGTSRFVGPEGELLRARSAVNLPVRLDAVVPAVARSEKRRIVLP